MPTKPDRSPAQQAIVTSVVETTLAAVSFSACVALAVLLTASLVEAIDRGMEGHVALEIGLFTLVVSSLSVAGYHIVDSFIRRIRERLEEF